MNILLAHIYARNNVVICGCDFSNCTSHLAVALLNEAAGINILSVHECANLH